MKRFFSIILCVITVVMTGCSDASQDERHSYYHSVILSEQETSHKEAESSREAEIEEVDKWGISLDDVDRLAKDTIRKHEMKSEYKSDYNKIAKEIDTFLNSVKSGRAVEYDLEYLLKKHNEACKAGIEYIQSSYDVQVTYNLFMTDSQLSKSERDVLRTMLTTWNRSIKEIEQSESDMKSLLDPIVSENRKLTDEEIQNVDDIYHVLTDIILKVN